jgi:hypothetical protein
VGEYLVLFSSTYAGSLTWRSVVARQLLAFVTTLLLTPFAVAPAAPVPAHLFPQDAPLYYPVQKGTPWAYDGDPAYTLAITSAEKDEKNEATILVIEKEMSDGTKAQLQKLAISRRGILWLESMGGKFDTPVWLLKTSARPGEEWPFTTSGPGVADTRGVIRVVGSEDVEAPAGKFSAVCMEQKATLMANGKPTYNFIQTLWYASGVGLVKWTCGGSGAVLKSFTPGKD